MLIDLSVLGQVELSVAERSETRYLQCEKNLLPENMFGVRKRE